MSISRRRLLAFAAALPAGGWLGPLAEAQQAAGSQPAFSTDVKVVNVYATVRNKNGQIVRGLAQDDFTLDEDGRPQTIRYFAAESDLPLTLGLLVDTSGSQRRVLNDERDASYRFFNQVLREDRDQAFVIHFDHEVELLQDLTSSRQRLERALDQLQIGTRQQARNGGGGYPGRGYPPGRYPSGGGFRGGTDLYDAVLLASDEVIAKQKGRKALIVLSDGVDRGSKTTLFRAIESAQKADTMVYTIMFADNEAYQPAFGRPRMGRRAGYPRAGAERPDGKKVLEQMARETGGRFFEATHKQPVDKIFAQIEEDLRNQYSIGYTSDQPATSAAYRHIHLAARKKDLIVQCREGYYPR